MVLNSCAVLCRTGRRCVGGETEEVPPNHNTDQIWGNYQPSSHHKPGNTAMDGPDADHTLVTIHTPRHKDDTIQIVTKMRILSPTPQTIGVVTGDLVRGVELPVQCIHIR